jgi:hypothetical protein
MCGNDAIVFVPGLCRGENVDNSVCAGHDVLFIVSELTCSVVMGLPGA